STAARVRLAGSSTNDANDSSEAADAFSISSRTCVKIASASLPQPGGREPRGRFGGNGNHSTGSDTGAPKRSGRDGDVLDRKVRERRIGAARVYEQQSRASGRDR